MNFKKVTAFALVATMVIGNSVTVFADQGTATGDGSYEYDNSVDVEYDSVTLPTLSTAMYTFTLDPNDELHTFSPSTYPRESTDSNPGVYFHSTKASGGAKIEKSTESGAVDIFKKDKTVVAATADELKDVVTGVTAGGDGTITAVTLTDAVIYYVWTPKEFTEAEIQKGAKGKAGQYTKLTADNFLTYFDIGEKDVNNKYAIAIKEEHLSNGVVCDGKIYKDAFVKIDSAIQEDIAGGVTIDEYVELEDDKQSIKSVKGVYIADTSASPDPEGYVLAAASDIKFTPAAVVYQASSDKATIVNKSTKKKTVKAAITLSNVGGLTFKDEDDFSGDTDASVFFKATDDSSTAVEAVIAKAEAGATTATATYTVDIDGADLSLSNGGEIKYQGELNPKTGGHNYYKYEAANTAYNRSSFWIEAKANTETDAATAWKAYGKAVEEAYDASTGAATPKMNIVYTVTDYEEAPTTYTVTYKANDGASTADQTETVNVGSNPTATGISFTRDGYTFKGWGATASATEADKVTLSDISEATDLYAIWAKDVVTGTLAVQKIGQNTYATVKGASGANLEEGKLTSLKINDVDFTAKAIFYEGLYGVKGADLIAESISVSSGAILTAVYTVDGTDYTATYTMP